MADSIPLDDITIKIGGAAGYGIKAGGQSLARVFVKGGLHTFDWTEYPSLIRGGHNVYRVRVATEEVFSHVEWVNVLVALNQETADLHMGEIVEGGAVIYDPAAVKTDGWPDERRVRRVPVPLDDIAANIGGNKIMRNTAANAAILGMLEFPLAYLEDSIREQFAHKKPEIADKNVAVGKAAYEAVAEHARDFPFHMKPREGEPQRIMVDGNEAVGLGALAAGIGFYAAYPMTPASNLLHFMASEGGKRGVVVKHTEDELAAMNMVVGAAFSGARAMCASAGGGFALMVEAFGFAGVSESAVVVGVFSRTAPGTGLPTYTEQGDLRFVIHAAPSTFPRVVLAPGDRDDAFHLAWQAFNLADVLQTPVVILSDQWLQESRASCLPFDASRVTIDRGKLIPEGNIGDHPEALGEHGYYERYRVTDDGVSWRALPGVVGAEQIVNSYEHDEYGWATEAPDVRTAEHEKRMRKLELARTLVPKPAYFGPKEADLSVILFGSTKGPVREAMKWAAREGLSVNMMQVVTTWPFPAEEVTDFIDSAKRTLVVEGNINGLLEGLIREHCLRAVDHRFHRYDGRPFSPEQLLGLFKEVCAPCLAASTHR